MIIESFSAVRHVRYYFRRADNVYNGLLSVKGVVLKAVIIKDVRLQKEIHESPLSCFSFG